MHFTDLHTLLSPVAQLENIPGSEIVTSAVKTADRTRFMASVNRCFCEDIPSSTGQTRVISLRGAPVFSKCSAVISSIRQRLTACGRETTGAKRTDA